MKTNRILAHWHGKICGCMKEEVSGCCKCMKTNYYSSAIETDHHTDSNYEKITMYKYTGGQRSSGKHQSLILHLN